MSPRRKWLFRLLAMIILPLAALALPEMALRLCGYGYDTSFFKPITIGGQNLLVENDSYGFRFFPPEVARLPRPIMIEDRKPAGVCRIFIFGESAAEGDPDPAFGPARFLEVLLRERYPQQRFEIVNVAVTANNSHGILPIARECARHQGDFWIIYMGNNEMIGPFGAAGVFGWKAPPLGLIRANLAVKQTRLGQLLDAAASYLKNRTGTASEWGGLEMFAEHRVSPTDPAKQRVYRNFQGNLNAILRVGLDSGAKILLNSVAVNLKDCPPLASEPSTALAPGMRADCEKLSAEAKTAEAARDPATAAKCLEQAAAIDPRNAELQYQWGGSLLEMNNIAAARDHFQAACDDDAVPARTDSRINALIRQSARSFTANKNLVLLDAASAVATNGGICGNDVFYEHVHFNPCGSFRLGRAWAEQVEALLPDTFPHRSAIPWASQELCERRLALTDWNRRNDLNEIVNRRHAAPLNGQSDNAEQLAGLQKELANLGRHMDSSAAAQARQICEEAIQRVPQDLDIHCNFADFLEAVGNFREAAYQWQQVQQLRPDYYLGYFQEGRMRERMGELDSARGAFQQTVALRPVMAPAWFELSNIAASEGDLDSALRNVQRASHLQPHRPIYYACMGKLLSRMNRHPDAVEQYRQALRVDPNYWEGHMALGGELASLGNWPAAQSELETGVRLRPDSIPAHLALGNLFTHQSRWDDAQHEFEHVLQLDPGNQPAQTSLNQLRLERGEGTPIELKN
jgi:tetratricopeptide (TPR) repeat protein